MKLLVSISVFGPFLYSGLANAQTCSSVLSENNKKAVDLRVKKIKKKLAKLQKKENVKDENKAKRLSDELIDLVTEDAREKNKEAKGQYVFPMLEENYFRVYYRGSNTSPDLSLKEHEKYRINVGEDGLLYNSSGDLLDTSYGEWIYCIYDNKLYVAPDGDRISGSNKRVRHPTICRGNAVISAGELKVSKGELKKINTNSGRYRLPPFAIEQARVFFELNGALVKNAKFKFFFREEMYLSPYDLNRMAELDIPINKNLEKLVEIGEKFFNANLEKMRRVDSDTKTDDLFDIQDFFIDWGEVEEPYKTEITQFFIDYISNPENKLGRRRDLVEELYRSVVSLNKDLVDEALKDVRDSCTTLGCEGLAYDIDRMYFAKF